VSEEALAVTEDQDRRLADYLLGRLADEEELRLETEYLADPAAQERLAVVEDDLVDAYARGALSSDERTRLEGRLLASPRGRRKLDLARALLAMSAGRSRMRRVSFVAAAAAAALIAVLVVRGRTGEELVAMAPEIALQPGATRDVGAVQRARIPRGAQEVPFRLALEVDRHPNYQVSLLGGAGARWVSAHLTSVATPTGRALVVTMPATVLTAGQQTLVVSGADDGKPLAQYSFSVERE
jgi:hypothetical protein